MDSSCNHLVKPSAVHLEDVCKSYGRGSRKMEILKKVNLNVPKGSIYGLLGSSGCGKTTLLKSIVGRLKVDSGKVLIFGQKLGSRNLKIPGSNVGYMPQELALYDDLRISEIFSYFGKIYGMSNSQIVSRISFLLELLHLPVQSHPIKTLSGGQKRRVSFAIALFSEPPLLILDEPTIGVDPLLRQNLWEYILKITESGKTTVILSTHYVEEAKQATKIGFMRNGRILLEDDPNALQTESQTLEDVFLDISTRDDSSPEEEMKPANKMVETFKLEDSSAKDSEEVRFKNLTGIFFCLSLTNILAVTLKNCKIVTRSYGTLGLQILIPAMQITLHFLTFGRPLHDLKLAVVNQDPLFGHTFLNYVDNYTINKILVPDVETGVSMVKDRSAFGVVEIPSNFSDSIVKRIGNPTGISLQTLNSSKLGLHLDMTDLQIATTLHLTLLKAYQDFAKLSLQAENYSEHLASSAFIISEPIYGNMKMDLKEYVIPAVMLLITFFMALALTGLSSFVERRSGIYDRNIVAGVNQLEDMMGQAVIQFGIVTVQVALNLLVAVVGFKLTCEGNVGLVIMLTVLIGICGMFYGYNLTALCDFESTWVSFTIGSLTPSILLSAVVWPIEAMPKILQTISTFLPLTLPNEALRNIIFRGIGFTHISVWPGFLSCIVWIIIFLLSYLFITKVRA